MKTLREYVFEAKENKKAIGHFNISNIEGFWAVVGAVKKLNMPAIIGVSEGERDFIGIKQIKALVDTTKAEGLPIFLNADHTYSFDKVKDVVDASFDAVIFDGAELSFEENKNITKDCVNYIKNSGKNILIEGELGFIGKSSKILDEIPDQVDLSEKSLTSKEEALEFVKETGVDMLAPAVGNMHGMLKGGVDPKLNIGRIKEISEATSIPLVLHGGSGNSEEDFKNAIANGISIVHINTELRVAFKQGIMKYFSENPDEVAPYKYMRFARESMQSVIEKKMTLFSNSQP